MAIFLNGNGMQRSGIAEGGMVAIETVSTDNVGRFPSGLRAIAYDIRSVTAAPTILNATSSFRLASMRNGVKCRPLSQSQYTSFQKQ